MIQREGRLAVRGLAMAVALFITHAASAADYRLGAGDVVQVSVHDEKELTRPFEVPDDCTIEVGLIGSVSACDRTVVDVAKEIQRRLGDGYLVNPQVTVEVAKYGSQVVQVMGEVTKPGERILEGRTTLLDVILAAGDRKGENVVDVELVRGGEVRLYDIAALPSMEPVYVQAGDVIVVKRPRFVYVSGGVKKDGPVSYREGLTLTQALTSAGGTSEGGRLSGAKLVRVDGDQLHINIKRILSGKQADVVLQPEDQLIVRGW